ncbi:MAG: hypothetical protein NTY36_14485 [Deltaproteobacteria bacterium]|nr:hypothetical protein [Deltaproteobacteria bacterium]
MEDPEPVQGNPDRSLDFLFDGVYQEVDDFAGIDFGKPALLRHAPDSSVLIICSSFLTYPSKKNSTRKLDNRLPFQGSPNQQEQASLASISCQYRNSPKLLGIIDM